MKIDVVILAAGQGSRMRSSLPKVLHPIGGQPMLQQVVDAANAITIADGADIDVHIVIGHGADQVREVMGDQHQYAVQREQLGTGHAVAQALPLLNKGSKTLVLYGDVPLIKTDTLQAMIDAVDDNTMAVLTTELDDATGYGRIVRDASGAMQSIVEQKDANDEQLAIKEINTGIMCIPQAWLEQWLPQLSNSNAQNEYYLTDIIALAARDGVAIKTPQPESAHEVQGVNNRQQLAELERILQSWRAEALMVNGATLADPARIDIRGQVNVGQDVFIDINTVFKGDVTLGANVTIGPNCVITNATIADGSEIHANSVIEDAEVGKGCSVGPYGRLRPGARLADKARVGNFVEVKNATLGEGSKANHLAYLGDAEIGANSNIGAGTITCNYDGANKFKTTMGKDVFIGSNSTLVAPLEIEDGGFVGAGSTITTKVPSDNLAVGRGKQRNIAGWKKPQKNK